MGYEVNVVLRFDVWRVAINSDYGLKGPWTTTIDAIHPKSQERTLSQPSILVTRRKRKSLNLAYSIAVTDAIKTKHVLEIYNANEYLQTKMSLEIINDVLGELSFGSPSEIKIYAASPLSH